MKDLRKERLEQLHFDTSVIESILSLEEEINATMSNLKIELSKIDSTKGIVFYTSRDEETGYVKVDIYTTSEA